MEAAIDAETAEMNNAQLRKRERPFLMELRPETVRAIEAFGALVSELVE